MLELLRKDASYFFSKILLGFIALVFVLYFGFNFRSRGRLLEGTGSPIARVNNQIIPSGTFSQDVQNQMSLYQQITEGKVPPDTEQMVENQVLQRLISDQLLAQEAYRLGLRVPDIELAKEIRNNPGFIKNGVFDEDFYLNQFKPYFERQNGQDYEYSLREELLSDKLKNAIELAAVPSEAQTQDNILLKETKLKLRKLTIPLKSPDGDIPKEKAIEMANTWIAARQSGGTAKELLKDSRLKEEETEAQSLQEMQLSFGGEDSLPILYCLLGLKTGQVCESPLQVGQSIVAVELLDRKDAAFTPEDTEAMQTQLSKAKKIQLLTGVTDLLTKDARIETYLKKK
jgi:parvulin-like peptidyl-prolyl isomerase